MNAGVVGDEAQLNPIPLPAPHIREGCLNGGASRPQNTAAHGAIAHVKHKNVHGRLRWPHHVLHGGHKLNTTLAKLRTMIEVLTLPRGVRGRKVLGRCVVHKATKVAVPSPAGIHKGRKGVDVGSAPSTAYDTHGAIVNKGDTPLSQCERSLGKGLAHESQRETTSFQERLIPGNCAQGHVHVPRETLPRGVQFNKGSGSSRGHGHLGGHHKTTTTTAAAAAAAATYTGGRRQMM